MVRINKGGNLQGKDQAAKEAATSADAKLNDNKSSNSLDFLSEAQSKQPNDSTSRQSRPSQTEAKPAAPKQDKDEQKRKMLDTISRLSGKGAKPDEVNTTKQEQKKSNVVEITNAKPIASARKAEDDTEEIPTTPGMEVAINNGASVATANSLTGEQVGEARPVSNTPTSKKTKKKTKDKQAKQSNKKKTKDSKTALSDAEQEWFSEGNVASRENARAKTNSKNNRPIGDFRVVPDSNADNFVDRFINNIYRVQRSEKDIEDNITDRELYNRRRREAMRGYGKLKNKKYKKETGLYKRDNFDSEVSIGNTEESSSESEFHNSKQRMGKAADKTLQMYITGSIPIQTMHYVYDENGIGVLRYSDDVESEIKYWCQEFNCTELEFMQLLMCRLGISIDINGNVMNGESLDEWELSVGDFVKVCNLMVKAYRTTGNPLAMIDNSAVRIGGSYRYPVPPPIDLCVKLTNDSSNLKFTAEEFYEDCRKEWLNKTQPSLEKDLTKDKINQRLAIYNMVRALHMGSNTANQTPLQTLFNVSESYDNSFQELLFDNAATKDALEGNPKGAEYYEMLQEREEYLTKHREKLHRDIFKKSKSRDENGVRRYTDVVKRTRAGQICIGIANWIRWAGIVGDPALALSMLLEHGIGNIDTIVSNAWLGRTVDKSYHATSELKDYFTSPEAVDAINNYKRLVSMYGIDAARLFASKQIPPTETNINKFISEEIEGRFDEPTKVGGALRKVQKGVSVLSTGDLGFGRIDAKRFIEVAMVNFGLNAKNGRPALTNDELLEAIGSRGVESVINDMILQGVGQTAIVDMRNATFARVSPISEGVKRLMRKNGLTNLIITTYVFKYVEYGVNIVQLLFPLSNTASFLATKGLYTRGVDLRDQQLGGEGIESRKLSEWSDAEKQALRKCLIYDCVKFGQYGLTALFIAGLQIVLGFDDPDDPENVFNYDEYKVGGEAYKVAWWLHDLVGWGLPLATAMNVALKHQDDPMRAVNVFWDGMGDITSGSVAYQAMMAVFDPDQTYRQLLSSIVAPDMEKPTDWVTNLQIAGEDAVAELMKDVTPRVINSFKTDTFFDRDKLDRDPYHVYDKSSDADPGDTKEVTDPVELARRLRSSRNTFYGHFLNLFVNGWLPWEDHSDSDKTGYLYEEMPINDRSDPHYSSWIDRYYIDFNSKDTPKEGTAEFDNMIEEKLTQLQSDIKKQGWTSAKEAVSNGFALPGRLRYYMLNYSYKQIYLNKADFIQHSEAGDYPNFTSSFAASTRMSKANSDIYDFIDGWLKNKDLPWSEDGYVKRVTDSQTIYYNTDTGEAATWSDYAFNNADGKIAKRVKPYGNRPTSFLPITKVETEGTGYNAETINAFYDPKYTDTDKLFKSDKGKILKMGKEAGSELAGVTFGGYGPLANPTGYNAIENAEDGNVIPTINERAWIPLKDVPEQQLPEEYRPEDVLDATEDEVLDRIGFSEKDRKAIDDAIKSITSGKGSNNSKNKYPNVYKSWKRSGGRSYSSGSSYNPKIYSNSRILNVDRAATMSIRQPYGATTRYLNPAFYTKGSREAYRREDF